MDTISLIKSLMPVIVIQLLFQVIALGHLFYKKKTRNLDPWLWAFIIIIGSFLGALMYFTIGREED